MEYNRKKIARRGKTIIVWMALACLVGGNGTLARAETGAAGFLETDVDAIIQAYYKANALPGLSVAVIRDGNTIYRKGFGFADTEEKKPAHAETIYNIGSVSKSIGATLTVKLEQEGRLGDGTPIELDIGRPTAHYLTNIPNASGPGTVSLPAFHTHTVGQLLSHMACVAGSNGGTVPAIADQSIHYERALDAVQTIWDAGLVTKMSSAGVPEGGTNDGPCIMGKTWSYSTPGFTFIGAVLESATGRTIGQLLRDELLDPHGLAGIAMKYASPAPRPNDNRASLYDEKNHKITQEDNSWRILGGGMEANAVDLARFGWLLLDGKFLNSHSRDNRLWRRVDAINPNPGYAMGWGVGTDPEGRRIAEHPGMATGGRALLRIYRDDALVIAMGANRREHPVDDVHVLADRIGETILRRR